MFNVEEKNLLAVFHTGSRTTAMEDIRMVLGQVEDKELEELCRHVMDKLTIMSDEEYAALNLEMDEEFRYGE